MMPTDENMQTPVVEETGTDTDTRRGETNTEWRVGREGKREGRRGAFGARPSGDSINDEVTQKMSRVCQHFAYVGAAPSIRQRPPTGTATSSVYAEGLAPSPMKRTCLAFPASYSMTFMWEMSRRLALVCSSCFRLRRTTWAQMLAYRRYEMPA